MLPRIGPRDKLYTQIRTKTKNPDSKSVIYWEERKTAMVRMVVGRRRPADAGEDVQKNRKLRQATSRRKTVFCDAARIGFLGPRTGRSQVPAVPF